MLVSLGDEEGEGVDWYCTAPDGDIGDVTEANKLEEFAAGIIVDGTGELAQWRHKSISSINWTL